MKNKNILVLILFVSLLANIAALFTLIKYKNIINDNYETQQKLQSEFEEYQKELNSSVIMSYSLKNRKLDSKAKVICFSDTSTLLKHYLGKKHNILVMRITDQYCQKCYGNTIQTIYETTNRKFFNNILVITSKQNLRYISVLFKNLHYKNTVIGLENKNTFPNSDHISAPYFFIIDSTHTTGHYYVSNKNNIELTEQYLNIIKNLYFAN